LFDVVVVVLAVVPWVPLLEVAAREPGWCCCDRLDISSCIGANKYLWGLLGG
jgi:hypothetical protein